MIIMRRINNDDDFKVSTICGEMFDNNLAQDTFGGNTSSHTGKEGAGCDNMTAVIVFFKHEKNQDQLKEEETADM